MKILHIHSIHSQLVSIQQYVIHNHDSLSVFTVSLDYISGVQFDMPGVLLYSDGDGINLTWTPSDMLPTEIANPNDYQVTVEVYAYISNAWILFEEFDSVVNSGTMVISMLMAGPNGTDPIVPIAFRIKVADSVNLKDYIRPVVQAGQIGIWSPVAYKIASPNDRGAEMCSEYFRNQISEFDVLKKAISCPCRADQARVGNSMFLEQLSSIA